MTLFIYIKTLDAYGLLVTTHDDPAYFSREKQRRCVDFYTTHQHVGYYYAALNARHRYDMPYPILSFSMSTAQRDMSISYTASPRLPRIRYREPGKLLWPATSVFFAGLRERDRRDLFITADLDIEEYKGLWLDIYIGEKIDLPAGLSIFRRIGPLPSRVLYR